MARVLDFEAPLGHYQFTDLQAANCPQRFYLIRFRESSHRDQFGLSYERTLPDGAAPNIKSAIL